jgi:hypothetical protein
VSPHHPAEVSPRVICAIAGDAFLHVRRRSGIRPPGPATAGRLASLAGARVPRPWRHGLRPGGCRNRDPGGARSNRRLTPPVAPARTMVASGSSRSGATDRSRPPMAAQPRDVAAVRSITRWRWPRPISGARVHHRRRRHHPRRDDRQPPLERHRLTIPGRRSVGCRVGQVSGRDYGYRSTLRSSADRQSFGTSEMIGLAHPCEL